jgi:hypothetical protein
MIKNILSCRRLQVYQYAPFVVTSSAHGELRPVYGQGYLFAYIDDRIIFGLVHHRYIGDLQLLAIDTPPTHITLR